ncbi:MAG TPA: histidine phosphatase family protein [Solirubrobacteraceae bacterium]|jgi:phosphohistidine phosphatase
MKRIYLLRHAKSSWKDDTLPDHDRPLAGRGRKAAKAIARHLRAEAIAPELVLCSTALRVRQTLERIEPALGRRSVRVEADLYGASAHALLERLRGVPDTVSSVMVIGHNPGLQELVLQLARPGPELSAVRLKFPTAALATLAFAGARWADLDAGAAELVAFVRPRDLPG